MKLRLLLLLGITLIVSYAIAQSNAKDVHPVYPPGHWPAGKPTPQTNIENTFIGQKAFMNNRSGSWNTAFGVAALIENTSGNRNTACGISALYNITTGSENTALGCAADVGTNLGTITNSTAIGYNSRVYLSNQMVFGNDKVEGWGFGAATPDHLKVFIVGTNSGNGNGAYLSAGGNWTNNSSRDKKEDFSTLNDEEVLNKIRKMDIARWRYKGTDEYHIGPVAEDFYDAFHVGVDNKSISTIDPAGIALIGIKAINRTQDEMKDKLQQQQKLIEQQNARIEQLEKAIEELRKK